MMELIRITLNRRCFLLPLLLAIFTLTFGCAKEVKEIRIGSILPLTGNAASAGEMAKRGIDLAIEEINNKGGIKGSKLFVIYEDSKGVPKDGVSAMQKLTSQYKVPAVIGGIFSSVTLAIAPIAEKTMTVLLSPASSNPQISDAGDYIFRVWPSDDFEGEIMANFVMTKLRFNKVAVLHSTDDYGVGIMKVFTKKFGALGGNVSIVENYHEGAKDFRTQLIKIKETQSPAVYIIGHFREMAQILRQKKELAINSQFLSVSAFEVPELLELAGNAAEGVIYVTPMYDSTSEEKIVISFVNKFQEKYQKKPGIVEAHAYDAVKVLSYAMEKGGISGAEIKEALYQIRNYSGITGQITFDYKGDVIKPLRIKTVINKSFSEYRK